MPLEFDATLKDLARTRPVDWVTLLDAPPTSPVEILTPDLSTVSAFSDVVFRVGKILIHLEYQSGPDPVLGARLLLYNALLFREYGLPVLTIVILLRPSADRANLTGSVNYRVRPNRGGMAFTYDVFRVWEDPVENLLTAGLGVLPLATLGRLPEGVALDEALPGIVERMVNRIVAEATPQEAQKLLTSAYILTGLRLPRAQVTPLFRGVQAMRDSDTYMAILDEGRAEGEVRGARRMLFRQGRKRFGEPVTDVLSALQAVNDLERLERMSDRVLEASSWQDLIATP